MHYYKRHLGDYARDTGHLTALEHGVYTLLLDWYYANERPIPLDKPTRIARGNPEETQMVLDEFFHKTPEGWIHGYADRQIAEYQAKAERNREVGKLGGRPPKTQTVSKRNPEETLTINHKPLTTNHKEAKAIAPRGGRLPADWFPSDEQKAYAETQGVNVSLETENFRDYWHAKAGKDACKTDWGLTWKTWVRRAPKLRNDAKPAPSAVQGKTKAEALTPCETPGEAKRAWLLQQVEYGVMTKEAAQAAMEGL